MLSFIGNIDYSSDGQAIRDTPIVQQSVVWTMSALSIPIGTLAALSWMGLGYSRCLLNFVYGISSCCIRDDCKVEYKITGE